MPKESILQVRMDSQMKEAAESLYKSLGTSFPEAVRVFAAQSIRENGYPFVPVAYKRSSNYSKGILHRYSDPSLIEQEGKAFLNAMVEKYE